MAGIDFLLFFLALQSLVVGFSFEISGGGRECFYERVDTNTGVTVQFEVIKGGNKGIDFTIKSSKNVKIYSGEGEMSRKFTFMAVAGERYSFCFDNSISKIQSKVINFDIHIRGQSSDEAFATQDDLTPLEKYIVELEDGLREVSNEQKHLKVREARHRATVNNTNKLAAWLSFFEMVTILSSSGFLVFLIRRSFKKSKLEV